MTQLLTNMKIKISLKINSEFFFYILLLLIWSKNFVTSFLEVVIKKTPIIGVISDYIIMLIYFSIFLLSLKYILKNIKLKDLVVGILVIIVTILNLIIYNNQYFEVSDAISFIFKVFSLYYVGRSIKEYHIDYLFVISIISILVYLIYNSIYGVEMNSIVAQYQGDMDLAYKLLPHLCLITTKIFEKNYFAILVVILGFILLFSCGTRGAFFIYITFVVIYMLFFVKYKKKVVYICLPLLLLITVLSFDSFLLVLNNISMEMGRSNRIFDKFITNMILEDSGRNYLWIKSLQALLNNPILGYGIAGDRLVLNGTYSHNIIIEILLSFGVFLGTFIIFGLCYIIIKGIKTRRGNYRVFLLVLVFSCVFKLMLSQTYLSESYLFILLGMCVTNLKGKVKNNSF